MIPLETRVKFVLYAWTIFMVAWITFAVFGKADWDDLEHYVVEMAMGLGSAVMLMFDVKRTPDASDRKTDTPKTQEQLINDLIATSQKKEP